ncbi:MAG TPA: hypothetical protein DIW64_16145 [Cellvibrio sp.]|nr:hypothetical protein [Cellvibrio sp.]
MQINRVPRSGIKSIQRSVSYLNLVDTLDVAVSAVDMSKAELKFLGLRTNSANYGATVELVDSTTVRIKRAVASNWTYVSWELVENE